MLLFLSLLKELRFSQSAHVHVLENSYVILYMLMVDDHVRKDRLLIALELNSLLYL